MAFFAEKTAGPQALGAGPRLIRAVRVRRVTVCWRSPVPSYICDDPRRQRCTRTEPPSEAAGALSEPTKRSVARWIAPRRPARASWLADLPLAVSAH